MIGLSVILAGVVAILAISIVFGLVRTQLWIRRLGSPKRPVREQARVWFSMQGRPSIAPLLRALRHKTPLIRREAAEVLGDIGGKPAILPLLDALDDHEKNVRWEAITALGRLQALAAIPRLSNLAVGPDKESRRRSIEALGRIGGNEALEALEHAAHDEDVGVRKNALAALSDRERFAWRHIPLFVDTLRDVNADVRLLAAETLTMCQWQPENDRDGIAYALALRNWSAPLLTSPAAVEPLLDMLRDERPENLHDRLNSAVALGKIGAPQAFEPLAQMCHHIEANIRATAVAALGDSKDERAIPVLTLALKDTAAAVRAASAAALGHFADARSVEALIRALGDIDPARLGDRSPDVQRAAAAALEHIPGARVTATLVHALNDDDAIVRYEASDVLIQRGWKPKQEEEAILWAIARENWDVVKNFGAPALPYLMVRSADKERGIRDFAATLLTSLLASVKIVAFGNLHVNETRQRITFRNPDVDALTVPMAQLEHLVVHVPTYEFHRLERFLTYAVNYVGQQHLKQHVVAHVYGHAADLHPNLLNTLKNICKDVQEHV